MDSEKILSLMGSIKDPVLGIPLKDLKAVTAKEDGNCSITVTLGYPVDSLAQGFAEEIQNLLKEKNSQADVVVTSKIIAHRVRAGVKTLPTVKNVIAVASGKGGVGKSTVAVNVALALSEAGARVGILDADIYGPSQPLMLGIAGMPLNSDGQMMTPARGFGLDVNSIGFLVEEGAPLLWRGPMASSALTQLMNQTAWNDLDYLIVDLPPGTGDIQLTLAQSLPLTGALIVTTPQDVSYSDATKALAMFDQVSIPLLGVVENMALFKCPRCGHLERIFGEGAEKKLAERFRVDILGELPLDSAICAGADEGRPTMVSQPQSEAAAIYRTIAMMSAAKVSTLPRDFSRVMPSVKAVS